MSGPTNYSFRITAANGGLEAAPSAAKRVRQLPSSAARPLSAAEVAELREKVKEAGRLRNILADPGSASRPGTLMTVTASQGE
jgi:hypothetical protein